MPDITKAEDVRTLELQELRRLSNEAVRRLDQPLQEMFRTEQLHAIHRSDRNKILSLVEEFKAAFRDNGPQMRYELAFVVSWERTARDVYRARWWINEYPAGVYFIYDAEDVLQYVGTCCGGSLGTRIYCKPHVPYRHVVDVVLFDRQWCHFALAFEAFAISRLRPPRNGEFMGLWIQPAPPFVRMWPQPAK